ncbi:MAG: PTS fructose transporter subunit IIA [Gammaproteobacteria bacterium]|nr:PTS fructose transporter subunit IIA [Gammaproteobacteria bacterium]
MINILIVTHNKIGEEILKSAETILGKCIPSVKNISIPGVLKPEELGLYADLIRTNINSLEKGEGVLILTDIFGATPSNLVHYFASSHNVKILSGLNLPMLIRILNYAEQPLELLAKTGIVGANKGITKETNL